MIAVGNPKFSTCVNAENCSDMKDNTAICVCALLATRSLIYKGSAQNGGCTVKNQFKN